MQEIVETGAIPLLYNYTLPYYRKMYYHNLYYLDPFDWIQIYDNFMIGRVYEEIIIYEEDLLILLIEAYWNLLSRV